MTNKSRDGLGSKKGHRGHDILPKIFCVIAAFILWLYVTQVEASDYEETFNGVMVELVNTSVLESETGLHVYNGYGNTVNVTVSGKKSNIDRYSSENIVVFADVSKIAESGKHSVPITVETPPELKVSSLSISSINVYVDVSATAEIDVKPKISTAIIGEGCELGELLPEYSLVTVTGPKNIVNNISHAQISLNLGTISSSVSTIGKLELISKNSEDIDMRYVQLSHSEIKVTVPIYTTKEVPLSVNYKHGYYNDKNVDVTFDPERIVIKGDPKVIGQINSLSLGEIDETTIVSDSMLVRNLILPNGCTTVDNIEAVNVNITHVGTVLQTFPVSNIKITGADKKDVEVLTKVLSVRLRGPKASLEKIKTEDITVTVDLSEYSSAVSGTVTVNASISVSGASKSVYPVGEDYQVQVKIG
ncbi:MAG: hypothetical protein E7578_09550 [Ruminococcaceae bacterium]|nr:hypothetical protein [Oscillospiraceae bacterium]